MGYGLILKLPSFDYNSISLTSHISISPTDNPADLSASWHAGTGPYPISIGCTP